MKRKKEPVKLSVLLSEDIDTSVRICAARERKTLSAVVEEALTLYFEHLERLEDGAA